AMSALLACPSCQGKLKYSGPLIPGKRVKCSRCQTIFPVKTADAVIEAEVDAASEAFGELSGLAGALSVAEHREPDARASGLSVRLGKRPRTGRKGKNTGLIIGLIAGGAGVVLLAVLGATFFVLGSVAETGPTSTSLDPETLA